MTAYFELDRSAGDNLIMSVKSIFLLLTPILFMPLSASEAEQFQTVYSFSAGGKGTIEGSAPTAALALDKAGLLYGSTEDGPAGKPGAVFRLNPATGEAATLYVFTGGADGGRPVAALTVGADGLIYGTTEQGGAHNFGTVFSVDPATRKLTVLHAFTGGADGANPLAKMTLDRSGALYGTTSARGQESSGTIFKVDPKTGIFTTLHTFRGPDGAYPEGALIFATATKVYGTTRYGGSDGSDGKGGNAGVVFEFDVATKRLSLLHVFHVSTPEGYGPRGQLVIDKKGIIYGAAATGPLASGYADGGAIFQLNPISKALKTLHRFGSNKNDGKYPYGGATIDSSGTLYGTTEGGGTGASGTIFSLNTTTQAYKILHNFILNTGSQPQDGLVRSTSGAFYGTTSQGGQPNYGGTIFKLSP